MWYVWFFDGIGSTIVSLIAGAIIGGFTGYKIGIHKKIKLIQKAGNSSEQNQTIELNGESDDTNTSYNVNVNMEQKAKNNAKRRLVVLEMEEVNQLQKAGKDSQQIQIGNVIINSAGITEERARAVFNEMIPQALANYTEEAQKIATERVNKLEERIMPQINQVEGVLPAFADPAFQVLLRKAQQKAAITERENDYDLLTELLVCHVQKGNDRKNRAGIVKAVDIIDTIDNDALCALTIAFVLDHFLPATGNAKEGIEVLSQMYNALIYESLPSNLNWLDHLDILGVIRITPFSQMNKIEDIFTRRFDGYVSVGIKKGTEEYESALQIIQSIGLNKNILVDNIFLDDYVRLEIGDLDDINSLSIFNNLGTRSINQREIEALRDVINLYEKNVDLQNKVKERFMNLIDEHEPLKTLQEWWNSISGAFSITGVGKIIAYINAKRCIPELPDILE